MVTMHLVPWISAPRLLAVVAFVTAVVVSAAAIISVDALIVPSSQRPASWLLTTSLRRPSAASSILEQRLLGPPRNPTALALSVPPFEKSRRHNPPSGRGSTSTSLRAIIYGADGRVVITEEEEEPGPKGTTAVAPFFSSLKDAVASRVDGTTLLATVACAVAPPPHDRLHPQTVVTAEVVRVDTTAGGTSSLDVALAVPASLSADPSSSSHQLVQILVSVTLPQPCGDGGMADGITTGDNVVRFDNDEAGYGSDHAAIVSTMAECIIEQLQDLEAHALDVIVEREKQTSTSSAFGPPAVFKEREARQRLLRALEEEPYAIDLPNWWTFPELKILVADECSSLKSLLNEDDFAADLLALCRMHHGNGDGGGGGTRRSSGDDVAATFRTAKVAAIGPSGILLKAAVDDDDDVDTIVEVAIPFPPGRATSTADDLRENVLTLVESAEEEAVPTPAVITAHDNGHAATEPDAAAASLPMAQVLSSDVVAAVRADVMAPVELDLVGRAVMAELTAGTGDAYEARMERTRRQMLRERLVREQNGSVGSTDADGDERQDDGAASEPSLSARNDDDVPAAVTAADESFSSRLELLRRAMLHARLQEQRRSAQHEMDARVERSRRRMLEFWLENELREISRVDVPAAVGDAVEENEDGGLGGSTESSDHVVRIRMQPKSLQEEAELAAKYAAIEDLGERAYAIVKDLEMI